MELRIEWRGVPAWFAADEDGVMRMVANQRADHQQAQLMAKAKGCDGALVLLEELPPGAIVIDNDGVPMKE